MQKYSEFESIFEDSILLKISDSSARFQIPIGILSWIPVGVGPLGAHVNKLNLTPSLRGIFFMAARVTEIGKPQR